MPDAQLASGVRRKHRDVDDTASLDARDIPGQTAQGERPQIEHEARVHAGSDDAQVRFASEIVDGSCLGAVVGLDVGELF